MNQAAQVIIPKDEAEWLSMRCEDVTSTESPALFGLSPWLTEFELHHRKRERAVIEIEMNERMRWGQRLQDAVAAGIAEDNGWKNVRRMPEYLRLPGERLGASFDFAIGDEGLLEIKTVDYLMFRDGWLIDGDSLEAPPHIEIQVQHQLAVSGRKFAYIGALVAGNRVALIKREPDLKVIDRIRSRAASFWAGVDQKIAPRPDYSRDAEFISRLFAQADAEKTFDARGNPELNELMVKWKELGESEKSAKGERDAIKAKILTLIGDAGRVLGDGWTISAKTTAPARIEAYERAAYRNFRPSFKVAQ